MPSWKLLLKEGDVLCFYDIVVKVKELNKVISVCKLVLVSKSGNKLSPPVKDRFPLTEDWKHVSLNNEARAI